VRAALAGGTGGDEDHWAARVQELADAMATVLPSGDAEAIAALEHEYEHALEQLSGAANRLPDHVVARVLAGLGLAELDAETPVEILSGGQKTRLSLAVSCSRIRPFGSLTSH
jgi:ATPase subunit of ABC transporter with duplicated ATPase domains